MMAPKLNARIGLPKLEEIRPSWNKLEQYGNELHGFCTIITRSSPKVPGKPVKTVVLANVTGQSKRPFISLALPTKRVGGDVAEWSKALPC